MPNTVYWHILRAILFASLIKCNKIVACLKALRTIAHTGFWQNFCQVIANGVFCIQMIAYIKNNSLIFLSQSTRFNCFFLTIITKSRKRFTILQLQIDNHYSRLCFYNFDTSAQNIINKRISKFIQHGLTAATIFDSKSVIINCKSD